MGAEAQLCVMSGVPRQVFDAEGFIARDPQCVIAGSDGGESLAKALVSFVPDRCLSEFQDGFADFSHARNLLINDSRQIVAIFLMIGPELVRDFAEWVGIP